MPDLGGPSGAAYEDFLVVLARQRSGTTALRSVLKTHPEIHCFSEILNAKLRNSSRPALRRQSYFRWLTDKARRDPEVVLPARQEELLFEYLDHLRALARAPVKVVDVKYNTAHLITLPYQRLGTFALFDLFREREMRVLNLVRRNYLRSYLSLTRAQASGVFGTRGDQLPGEAPVRLEVGALLWTLERDRQEDAIVDHAFSGYEAFLRCEYAEVFPVQGTADPAALQRIADWLGLEPSFGVEPKTSKLTALPLWEAIENWDEVEEALRGTRFAYCLADEPSYYLPLLPEANAE